MTAHVLDVDDLDAAGLERILARAEAWRADPGSVPALLAGRGVAAVFEKPSARTRTSTEMAVVTLGGHPIYIRPEEVGLDTRETVEDVARTLAQYCAAICARVHDHDTLIRMASVVEVPVVNLLSDRAHPLQAVADLIALRAHFGSVAGRRLAFVGDGNNVAASLAYAAALTGMELVVASPPGYELDPMVVDRARNLGGVVDLVADPYDAVRDAHAVYTDVWTSMGQEDERAARTEAFAQYQVSESLMDAAQPDAVFLHCLPAHRGEEVAAAVIDGPRSLVWPQAAARMDSARAVLAELVGGA
jgi:ornithine carbamoyltransferase